MKVAILTLGCRVNQSESDCIEGSLLHNGATIVNIKENPDYCVVNTCSVTSKSDLNSRQLIRRAAKAGAKVIVTGCYAQLNTEEASRLPGVWKIIDSRNKLEVISELTNDNAPPQYAFQSRSRPYLKAQDGCNLSCSYCSVPLARGRSRSLPEDELLARAQAMESAGFHELVLTGIHLGSYGKDLQGNYSLKKLLIRLLKESSVDRIRLSSLEIGEIDDEMIDILQESRICRHLHLPLQSGSQRILRLMRRGYSLEAYGSTVDKIARKIDHIAIGTDIIAGFPGESEDDFDDTMKFVSDLPLSYMHIFPFSPRPGTDAERMNGRPDALTTKKRVKMLSDVNCVKKNLYMTKQLGRRLEVIAEEVKEQHFFGTSGNYLKILVSMPDAMKGSLVAVRPTDVSDGFLRAIPINGS